MNRGQFVASLAEKLQASKKDTEMVVDAVIETVIDGLVADGTVVLTGNLTARVVERAAREGYNPKTEERIQIPATTVVNMKAGKTLRDTVVERINANKKAAKKAAKTAKA
jgi:DNA-binding protein HU-beta